MCVKQPFPVKTIHKYCAPSVPRTIKVRKDDKVISVQESNVPAIDYTITYDGLKTTCILADGSKGVVKCMDTDEWEQQIGHDLAFWKARIKFYERKIEERLKDIKPSKKAALLKQIKETEDKIAEMKKEVSTL
jgi:hypothetical protein